MLSYLQPLVDADQQPGRFILTGSQQFEVMNTVAQTLAGRTAALKLLPLTIAELAAAGISPGTDQLLLSGFYPRIHDGGLDPTRALGDYVETYVQRDIRQLITIKDLALFEKFVRLCAGRIGQLLNLQSLGNDVGISHTTARSQLNPLLERASYVVFLLQPWHVNLGKRQIKTPKLYFHDVGLASYLLGAEAVQHISRHPLRGNLFENLIVGEALKYRYNRGKRSNLFFWRDAKGNEVDLVVENGADVLPVEVKAGATISPDYFRGLTAFCQRMKEPPQNAALVYDGAERQRRTGVTIWRSADVDVMLDECS